MTGDPTTKPNVVGVNQPAFDVMVGQYSSACSQVEQLSHALWAELSRADLDVSPALRLRDKASSMRARATDLKRRQRAVHDMERQKISFGVCIKNGTFYALPDNLAVIESKIDGNRAGDLANRAIDGDQKALSELQKYASKGSDPHFAKALLDTIGAKGTVELPGALAKRLLGDTHGDDAERLKSDKAQVQSVLRMLTRALAVGTDPRSKDAYVGDDYLSKLRAEGRGDHRFPGGGVPYKGYQSLATLLGMSDGNPPYSRTFMEIIGRDMIDLDRTHPGIRNPPNVPGPPYRHPNPFPDLVGLLNLGWALTPDRDIPTSRPPYGGRTDFLTGLMRAAALTRGGSQALFDYRPPGKNSNVGYLLHDRRAGWAQTDHGVSLGLAMKAAMSGHDATSNRLFAEARKIIAADTRHAVGLKGSGQLEFRKGGREELEQLSGLRPSLADIVNAHLPDVDRTFAADDISGGHHAVAGKARDYDGLLAYVALDDDAFRRLMTSQIARTRIDLDRQYRRHRGVDAILLDRMGMLGHLLAVRKEILAAATDHDSRAVEARNQQFKALVAKGIGYLPVPYAQLFGTGAKQVYEEAAKYGYGKAGDWLAQQAEQSPGNPDGGQRYAQDSAAAHDLVNQILLSSAAHNIYKLGKLDPHELARQKFVEGDPPRVTDPRTWDEDTLDSFTRYCERRNLPVPKLSQLSATQVRNAHQRAIGSFADPPKVP